MCRIWRISWGVFLRKLKVVSDTTRCSIQTDRNSTKLTFKLNMWQIIFVLNSIDCEDKNRLPLSPTRLCKMLGFLLLVYKYILVSSFVFFFVFLFFSGRRISIRFRFQRVNINLIQRNKTFAYLILTGQQTNFFPPNTDLSNAIYTLCIGGESCTWFSYTHARRDHLSLILCS